MKPLACNYAVARFLPYPETGEFVNVGVLLACPTTGFLGYQVGDKRHARVRNFFPELPRESYPAGLQSFTEHLAHFRRRVADSDPQQHALFPAEAATARVVFAELTRPRESMFRFGPPGTVLTSDPVGKLRELFEHYVCRQFTRNREYQEQAMASRLRQMLVAHQLDRFYKVGALLGSDDYHVAMPFVRYDPLTHQPVRAIKPLDLDRRGPTEILEYGDRWFGRLRRLNDLGDLPMQTLFAVRLPQANQESCYLAARKVEDELRQATPAVKVIPEQDEPGILAFAR